MLTREYLTHIKLYVLLASVLAVNASPLIRSIDRDSRTIYYRNQVPNARGDYHFEFQTTNGITTKAAGNANGASGVVQYISREGIPITMTYVADAEGYHPNGEHIPTTPSYVHTALEYIRTHAAVDEKRSRRL